MKKFLSIFLSLVLIIFQIDVIKVSANTIAQSGDYKYYIFNSTAKIIGYTGSEGNITIPSMIDGYTVTSIDNSAFYGCSNLKGIIIPGSVTSIGDRTFEGCSSLTNITIPNSVTSIGDMAFEECSSLTNITIPSSVTSIGDRTFQECSSLTNVTIPNSVKSIGNNAFSDCISLVNIKIPSSITNIGDWAFGNCSSLICITIPSGVISIGDSAFEDCGSLEYITIPSSVTSIGKFAFESCSSITSITIPSSVTSIGDNTFCGCTSLASITIPSSVTSIGNSTFQNCSSITSIIIPSSVTSIGNYAFESCSKLTSITIPSSVTSIGNSTFQNCSSITSITIPSSVISIGDCAFENCSSLTNITIPNSVTSIGVCVFCKCSSLTNIIIPSSLKSTGIDMFKDCSSITSITIPSSIISIGDNTFENCSSLTNVIIPSGVVSIGSQAFEGCSSLTSIIIPSSITSIGDYALYGCTKLTTIDVNNENTVYSSLDGVLYNKLKTGLISYPAGKTNSIFTVQSSVKSIGDWAFGCCRSLTSIIIPSSVTYIDSYTFSNCSSNLIIYYHNTAIGFTNPWNGYKTVPYNIVSYNGNGNTAGRLPVDNNIYTQGTKAAILKNTGSLVKTGYIFAGWNTAADGSGISYPANALISMNGTDVTLYAQWKASYKYTVSFNGNGGSDVSPVTNITVGTKITLPTAPTKAGYTFAGWNTAQDGNGTSFTSSTLVNENEIVYAQWVSISPSIETFIKATPSDLTAAITAPNKATNPVIGVYNGDTKLVGGTDEAVVPTATGYTLILYKSYLSKLTSNAAIKVKFRDGSLLNYSVILSTASISPSTETFTKTAPTNLTAVITAPNKLVNPVVGIYNGTTKLVAGTYESVVPTATGYALTLDKSYLSKLTSNTPIIIKFKDGSSLTYTVVLGATISPSTGTFTKIVPANLTAVITAPNKAANPVVGVYNGTTRLIAGTDQAIVPTTTGYTFTLYKSYLSKLTSTTVITLKFKDGSSINYTVNIK